jgi:hypothetical protein
MLIQIEFQSVDEGGPKATFVQLVYKTGGMVLPLPSGHPWQLNYTNRPVLYGTDVYVFLERSERKQWHRCVKVTSVPTRDVRRIGCVKVKCPRKLDLGT